MFKQAAAIWQKDKWKPIIATIVNLSLNIILVLTLPDEYKLDGVILATIVSDILVQMPWESYAVFTSFFSGKEAKCYWRRQSMYMVLGIIVCGITWGVTSLISIAGFLGFFLKGAVAAAVSIIILIIFLRDDVQLVLDGIKHHKLK